MLRSEIVALYAAEFAVPVEVVLQPRRRGSHLYSRIRMALIGTLLRQYQKRPLWPGSKGYSHVARALGLHHTTVMHAAERLPELLQERPGFARRVRLIEAMIDEKELATQACTA